MKVWVFATPSQVYIKEYVFDLFPVKKHFTWALNEQFTIQFIDEFIKIKSGAENEVVTLIMDPSESLLLYGTITHHLKQRITISSYEKRKLHLQTYLSPPPGSNYPVLNRLIDRNFLLRDGCKLLLTLTNRLERLQISFLVFLFPSFPSPPFPSPTLLSPFLPPYFLPLPPSLLPPPFLPPSLLPFPPSFFPYFLPPSPHLPSLLCLSFLPPPSFLSLPSCFSFFLISTPLFLHPASFLISFPPSNFLIPPLSSLLSPSTSKSLFSLFSPPGHLGKPISISFPSPFWISFVSPSPPSLPSSFYEEKKLIE